tara:strand:- start:1593 stop:2024 length:432 start_codon:yes stop_codon:yes gene_type:complete
MRNSLFCYGTLQSPEVIRAVTGHKFNGTKSELHNYGIFRVSGTDYPGIIPKKEGIVRGIVYYDISDEILRTLDHFEGDQYFRNEVTIFRMDGMAEKAFTYCIREDQEKILTDEVWDIGTFLDEGIERFMRSFVEERRNIFKED